MAKSAAARLSSIDFEIDQLCVEIKRNRAAQTFILRP
jgi:hypothetical protein